MQKEMKEKDVTRGKNKTKFFVNSSEYCTFASDFE